MNRRNADYIMRCNPRSGYPLVDDKVLTKELAGKNGVPVPALYGVFEHQRDIASLDQFIKGRSEFVVKPARGAGGGGIILITDH
ncbi:MAG: alpha-L-glutamate ligase-like protein, partial [Deltaproteobacteria bacterium]|nr:alpha-L-glutamate ligase-like protein [Deltaproteobacteria bacterium]